MILIVHYLYNCILTLEFKLILVQTVFSDFFLFRKLLKEIADFEEQESTGRKPKNQVHFV